MAALQKVERTSNILQITSLSILSLFLSQQMLLILVYGSYFFRKPFYVLDFIIVSGAIILESSLSSPGGGLLVVLMLWRAARVVHGFAISLKTEQKSVNQFKLKTQRLGIMFSRIFSYDFSAMRMYNMRQCARMIQRQYLKHFIRIKRDKQRELLEKTKARVDPDLTSDEARDYLTDDEYTRYRNLRRQVHEAKNRINRIKVSLPLFDLEHAIHMDQGSFKCGDDSYVTKQMSRDIEKGKSEEGIHRSQSMVELAMKEWLENEEEGDE